MLKGIPMQSRRALPITVCVLAVAGQLLACPPRPPRELKVSLSRSADRAVMRRDRSALVVEIQSATGIGQADLRPTGDRWPKSVRLRIRGLGQPGLEGFTLTKGKLTLHSAAGREWPESREWRQGNKVVERLVDRRYRLPIVVKPDGERQAAEITLPPELLTGDEPLHIEWVDAYRG